MAIEVTLPNMGEGIAHGDVVRVLVKPGDKIAENQGVAELETDKALVEVPSSAAGVVESVAIKEGDRVKIGGVLITVSANGTEAAAGSTATPSQAASAPAPAPAPAAAAAPTATQSVAAGNGKPTAAEPPRLPASTEDAIIPAGPATRRLARELGVDLRRVSGSGPHGRITKEDVQAFAASGAAAGAGSGSLTVSAPPLPDFSKWGSVERRPLSNVRRKTAEHMSLSWRLIPHVTQFEYADITALEALRKRQGDLVAAAGGKLTMTVLMLRALCIVLRTYPDFNSSLDEAAGELVLKNYLHIGIAVDTERGLLVPVLRDADKKDIPTLALELGQLSEKARSGHIDLEDLRGGTFTITNQGGIGGAEFTPIVNYPEVAILAMGRSKLQATVLEDGVTIAPRLILPLGLSYDHRVIDGAMAARFVALLKAILEDPERLLLGV